MRLFVPEALQAGTELSLPPGAARHAQVRRVQPGDTLRLFDGSGQDWPATVLAVGRSEVRVQLGTPETVQRELPRAVHIALAMPANERMDALVEKATELGVAGVQPLMSQRSVLRLAGERAQRKQQHWQAIAEGACEQCGRARVPAVGAAQDLGTWLAALPPAGASTRLLLSLQPDAQPLALLVPAEASPVLTLSGPEGGLTPDEEAAARRAGFRPVALGPRVLRADTAPLAVLAWLGLQAVA
ncbi:16S rRNA (uracil(1498)-N(3))-methyltransferase [Rubrivivax rivuli]|uniref:Ribosomal RNA small subunit methyltransferase E n=1 Tax=Rubrivivax rivuli TaxID=1862385 RepID=A0A437RQX8_9BURK|nr:16S rRNA (uracil(1498)-N(3))-methyltransferase [Rubrivivax rivuli]RVU49204.1 16S rRNA (uracil(1498)-N(3))-methyltransferase [Rubrivivax rivuli]